MRHACSVSTLQRAYLTFSALTNILATLLEKLATYGSVHQHRELACLAQASKVPRVQGAMKEVDRQQGWLLFDELGIGRRSSAEVAHVRGIAAS